MSTRIRKSLVIASSLLLGGINYLIFRDELNFPTNMRIKVSILEYHMLTRQKLDIDLLDIIDPNTSKELAKKSKELDEIHDNIE